MRVWSVVFDKNVFYCTHVKKLIKYLMYPVQVCGGISLDGNAVVRVSDMGFHVQVPLVV